uniref:Calmodulin n=1 Tax=Corethron hystrix TaxID=216773 RepID=A0A7S1BHL3_9STRA|mmetsp:Transcript_28410/g.64988  ORF Transcript_28410/g.64988 Transcript_28410/m.64988 type:complete len:640 (+) Transcript_28410:340-2259(+)
MGSCTSKETGASATKTVKFTSEETGASAPPNGQVSSKTKTTEFFPKNSICGSIQRRTSLRSAVVHIGRCDKNSYSEIVEKYDGVDDGQILGSGIAGTVRLVRHKKTGIPYAVKTIDRDLVRDEISMERLRNEIELMCTIDHHHIVRLEEVYETEKMIYMFQQLCTGGELFDRLDEQPDYHYDEPECARLVHLMLCTVRYLHSRGIVHRDLKLENFLFANEETSDIFLIDFGLSKHFEVGDVQTGTVGSPYTVAPEVIQGNYDEKCDVWSLGVITFLCLCGDAPFGGCVEGESMSQVRKNIMSGTFSFEPEYIWQEYSDEAKDFVRSLLQVDPKKRPSVEEAQCHPWFAKHNLCKNNKRNNTQLRNSITRSLIQFKECSNLRQLLSEIVAYTLLPGQIMKIEKEFENLDTDGNGEVSLKNLQEALRHLPADDVKSIYDAVKIDNDQNIHWREFLAAAVSMAEVDEKNLNLAFERIDSDQNGYFTIGDLYNLFGEQKMEKYKKILNKDVKITYEDFAAMMRGHCFSEINLDEKDDLLQAKKIQTQLSNLSLLAQAEMIDTASKFEAKMKKKAELEMKKIDESESAVVLDKGKGQIIQRRTINRGVTLDNHHKYAQSQEKDKNIENDNSVAKRIRNRRQSMV